jgi:hypothetical protein
LCLLHNSFIIVVKGGSVTTLRPDTADIQPVPGKSGKVDIIGIPTVLKIGGKAKFLAPLLELRIKN